MLHYLIKRWQFLPCYYILVYSTTRIGFVFHPWPESFWMLEHTQVWDERRILLIKRHTNHSLLLRDYFFLMSSTTGIRP